MNVLPNHAIFTVGVVDLLLHGLNVRWCDRVSRKINTLGSDVRRRHADRIKPDRSSTQVRAMSNTGLLILNQLSLPIQAVERATHSVVATNDNVQAYDLSSQIYRDMMRKVCNVDLVSQVSAFGRCDLAIRDARCSLTPFRLS